MKREELRITISKSLISHNLYYVNSRAVNSRFMDVLFLLVKL